MLNNNNNNNIALQSGRTVYAPGPNIVTVQECASMHVIQELIM